MRTLASLVVLVVLVTSCGDDGSSAERDESASVAVDYRGGATYVTGRLVDFTLDQGTVTTDDEGLDHSRDGTVSYRVVSGDARVDGSVTGTWNSDRWGDSLMDGALVQWGEATLTNDDGSWRASYAGALASPVGDMVTRWWVGEGAYEGLTFYMLIPGSEVGVPVFDWQGLIYPGSPPPGADNVGPVD